MNEQLHANVDPSDLLMFARVVELGSLSAAAESLGWPKSSVSQRLTRLERQLGERLLLRTTRRQNLTEFGHLLLDHARQVAVEVDAVHALREHRQAEPSGRLRVSMAPDIAIQLLAPALARFVRSYPRIELDMDLSARRVDLLAEGFDVALRIGELSDDGLLVGRLLGQLPASLYATAAYLKSFGEPKHPDDLAGHEVLHLAGRGGTPIPWRMRRGEDSWLGTPPGRVMVNSPEMLLAWVRQDLGIGPLPDYFVPQDELREGRLCRVLPEWAPQAERAWAVYPGRKLMPPKTRVFVDALVEVFERGCTKES